MKDLIGAGRKKGTKNKPPVDFQLLFEAACGHGWNPVVEMARIAQTGLIEKFDPKTGQPYDPPQYEMAGAGARSLCLREAAQYAYPKLRCIEVHEDQPPPGLNNGLAVVFVSPGQEAQGTVLVNPEPQSRARELAIDAEADEMEEEGD